MAYNINFDANKYRKVYFVGDIHGKYKLFTKGLELMNINLEKDLVISVGDLIDRGEDSFKTLSLFLNTPNLVSCLGNHEDMAIRACCQGNTSQLVSWIHNGGDWYLELPVATIKHLMHKVEQEFPIYITVKNGSKTIGVCHAETPDDSWDYVTSSRIDNYTHDQKALWGRRKIKDPQSYAEGVDLAIHGHSITDKPKRINNQVWIDTGSFLHSGGITFAELGEGTDLTMYKVFNDYDMVNIELQNS